jgi:hypothetical protein
MENSFDGSPRGIEWGEVKWKFQFNRGAALKNLDLASATRRPKMEIWAVTPRAQRSAEGGESQHHGEDGPRVVIRLSIQWSPNRALCKNETKSQ